jgi:hypothetical protein
METNIFQRIFISLQQKKENRGGNVMDHCPCTRGNPGVNMSRESEEFLNYVA